MSNNRNAMNTACQRISGAVIKEHCYQDINSGDIVEAVGRSAFQS